MPFRKGVEVFLRESHFKLALKLEGPNTGSDRCVRFETGKAHLSDRLHPAVRQIALSCTVKLPLQCPMHAAVASIVQHEVAPASIRSIADNWKSNRELV